MNNELNKRNLESLHQMMTDLQAKCYDFTIKMEKTNATLASLMERMNSLENRVNLILSQSIGKGSTVK